jgi:hypothetical protein
MGTLIATYATVWMTISAFGVWLAIGNRQVLRRLKHELSDVNEKSQLVAPAKSAA